MATTLEEVRQRLINIQAQLAEVTETIAELEAQPQAAGTPPVRSWPASIPLVDKAPLREAFDALMRQMGIENTDPIPAEELQERMRQRGIKPEDRILSSGIIEMREE
jgi:hypothetical protein